jgi:transcriptional regulator with XRE-family HTH domain
MRIKELRIQKGLTQEELAHAAGVAFQTINQVENGKRKPHKSILKLIAQALEVKTEELQ